jgi:NodT family efflux transporter outer membrane factor (OMF) lipoprotein
MMDTPAMADGTTLRAARAGAGACLGALLAACTVGPRYTPPDPTATVPAAYPVAATDGAVLAVGAAGDAWWHEFHDPQLDQLVAAALTGSPDLLAAEGRVAQARALAEAAGAHLYPQINVDGRVGRDKLSLNGENLALIPFTPSRTEFTDYRIGFDASWEIDLFGYTRRQAQAAIARAGGAEESRNDARVVLAAEVARNYLSYTVAVERLAVAGRNEAAYADTARLVGLQHAAGVASDLELNRAQADELASTSVSPALYADRQAALFRLATLTGLSVESVQPMLGAQRPPALDDAAIPVGLPADLLRRRPDVRRAERDLAAATADAGAAVAAQFPRLSLVGSVGLDSVHPGELVEAASRYWNVGPQLSVPVFSAGLLKHEAQAAEAARQTALASYRSVVLNALADAETALVRYTTDVHRAQAVRAAAARLRGTLDLTRLRYKAGEATLLEVMDAERSVYGLEDQLATLDGLVATDYVALQKALGGGWQQQ